MIRAELTLDEAKEIASSTGKTLQLWTVDGDFVRDVHPSPAHWILFARNAGTGEALEVAVRTQDVFDAPAKVASLPPGFCASEAEIVSRQKYEELLRIQRLRDQGLLYQAFLLEKKR